MTDAEFHNCAVELGICRAAQAIERIRAHGTLLDLDVIQSLKEADITPESQEWRQFEDAFQAAFATAMKLAMVLVSEITAEQMQKYTEGTKP